MSLQVRITPQAEAQIRSIDHWWRDQRPTAPDLFAQELADAVRLIGNAPELGRLYRQSPVPYTRRILLRGARYHLYYVVRGHEVWVLALWHAQRGVGPPIRSP